MTGRENRPTMLAMESFAAKQSSRRPSRAAGDVARRTKAEPARVPGLVLPPGRIPVHANDAFNAGGMRLQRKLAVGAVNDPLESEADAVADRVMRGVPVAAAQGAGVQMLQRCACGGDAGHECDSCKKNREDKLQRKAGSGGLVHEAPDSVHTALRSPGSPLDESTQSWMGARFGLDFRHVRIHADAAAAESARAVNALAYTVGRDIVFDSGQYRPQSHEGRRLLAHELSHVVQQQGGLLPRVQRACRSAAACGLASAGNAAAFGRSVEAESEALAVASGGVAVAGGHADCKKPRHGDRATNFEKLALTSGLGVTMDPGIEGFFLNACLSPRDGANNSACSDFPGGAPAGTNPAKQCVQIHTTDEDMATALLAKPKPLAFGDLKNFLWIAGTIKHESQHLSFDSRAGTVVPAAPDCNINTPVPNAGGAPVESLLSEIAAETSEFDVYFRNRKANPGRGSSLATETELHDVATRGGENILGNIKDIQCVCNCDTTAKFVEEVFNDTSSAWTPDEKAEFKKAMTGFLPSFWPKSLHQS
ncbi:eCIS core domain-containing protein [Silvibacterium acidisoli]|uniref:eCIS core domain-containing protein n=1 Tax=Acidobacteriaceae bacterium ZG23-2 TaxID=2883246 RepID=UPI00406C383F